MADDDDNDDNDNDDDRCSVCEEKFRTSDALRTHLCDMHPDQIGPNLKALLQKMSNKGK